MKLKLYRGISVSKEVAESTINHITTIGIDGSKGFWNFKVPNINDIRNKLDNRPPLIIL